MPSTNRFGVWVAGSPAELGRTASGIITIGDSAGGNATVVVGQLLGANPAAVPVVLQVPVDPAALAAGDHNGSTFYQHQRFRAAVLGEGPVEVSLQDGLAAVVMGLAAQESARTGQAIDLRSGDWKI